MVIRFKESVRVRVWGKEMSSFRKGEVHAVPTAVAGVLLAQGCAEPVADATPQAAPRRELVGFTKPPIEIGDRLLEHRAMRRCARLL